MRKLLLIALLLAWPSLASADRDQVAMMQMITNDVPVAGVSFVGVCDLSGVTCTHGWSAGCVKNGTQLAFRMTDNGASTGDFSCVSGSNIPLDAGQTPTDWCTAHVAVCRITTLYDQIGSCNLTATGTTAPPGTASTLNGQVVPTFLANHLDSSCTPSDTPLTVIAVANQTTAFSGFGAVFFANSSATLAWTNVASNSFFQGATGQINRTPTDGSWFAHVGVINGASSTYAVNGSSATGTLTSGAATSFHIGGTSAGADEFQGKIAEVVTLSNTLDSTHVTSVTSNERDATRWGF